MVAAMNSVHRLKQEIATRPIAAFVLITFGWSWGLDLLVYIFITASPPLLPPLTAPRTWGPLVATILVLTARGESVREFFRRVITVPSKRWIVVLAVVLPVVAGEIKTLLALLVGQPVSGPAYSLWVYPANFLLVFLFAGGLEEFGWRAFAQPRLQSTYSAVLVALGIGVLWTIWHLPLFLLFDMNAYDATTLPTYTLGLMAESVVMAWMFNVTDGSVLGPWLLHSAGNMPSVMSVSGSLPGVLGTIGDYDFLLSFTAVGGVLIFVYGRELAAGTSSIPGGSDRRETVHDDRRS